MSNYTKATNFAAKDALPTGNASKRVLGTEIDAEFAAIAIAIATKADLASPTFTGTLTAAALTATGTMTVSGGYLTVVNATNPRVEIHDPGNAAFMMYVASTGHFTICNTSGDGVVSTDFIKALNGIVTLPLQTTFAAQLSTDQTSGNTVLFDTEDHDVTGVYTPGAGSFTVPQDGKYQINAQVTISNATGISEFVTMEIRVDGAANRRTFMEIPNNTNRCGIITTIANLSATDVVTVYVNSTVSGALSANLKAEGGNAETFFSAIKVA